MYSLEGWIAALTIVLQWQNLGMIFGISLLGLIIGFLPGIGPLTALPLFLPITYAMQPGPALILLAVLYMSVTYGGSLSAILINTPGTGGSAATCIDGYPMSKQGKGATAIGISMMGSFIGGFIGLAGLIFVSPLIAEFAMKFQPAEFFMLAVLGLVLIAASTRGSIPKAFISGGFGALVSCVGMDLMTGHARFTFGSTYLLGGIPLIPLVIGLFAFGEIFTLVVGGSSTISETGEVSGSLIEGFMFPFRRLKTLIRSALIGLGIGIIPGEGSAVANFTAYLVESRMSKKGKEFGTGVPEGVLAPEASNNAAIMGALIPTLTLGIPGGGVAAVFLGGVMIHGLNPGFELFTRNIDILTILFCGLIVANFMLLIGGSILSRFVARVTIIPVSILGPAIIVMGIISTYAIRSQVFDVVATIVTGILAYFMRRYGFSVIPFLVAYILAPIAEESFFQATMLAGGGWASVLTFIMRPISATLFLLIILSLGVPAVKRYFARYR
ncbi:MAG: tripartite tricarboxylate transporter permease [Desulfobacteraceae bacterium]|nr:tripartite tricarboxylate transporter permease [Desulfobacteraceae bacterium]